MQQLQEGLVDFMVSGTAIWGSVAPRLQVFDFPFLWRDWAHVHGVVDGPVGREAADYLERTVRMRPLAWGDSFGFRQVITRSRDVTETGQLAGLKIRTIQSPIYVKAVELMGASPTPMAFGEVYTSLQTGVIDGYEHDASTTLQQRFYEVARFMARTRHIAGVLGLWASTVTLARLPAEIRAALERAAREAARRQRAMGPQEDAAATAQLRDERHDHPRDRRPRVPAGGRAALGRARRARSASPPGSRRSAGDARRRSSPARPHRPVDRALQSVDRGPRRRAGRRRRPAGRRPSRPAQPDSLDRGDRAPAARLADVRRRHRRAAARPAPARHRARAPALRAAAPGGRSRPAPRAARLLPVPGRSGLAAHRRERRRAPAGERPVGRGDFRGAAGRAPPDVGRGRRSSSARDGLGAVARSIVARAGRSARPASPSPRSWSRSLAGAAAARRARHRLSRHRRRSACRSPSRWR